MPHRICAARHSDGATERERRTTMRKQHVGAVFAALACVTALVFGWAGTVDLLGPGAKAAQGGRQGEVIVLTVRLPADAVLLIDDHKTQETGGVRTFRTPPLAVGGHYAYTLKAMSQGKEVTRKIHLAHGVDNTFDLRAEFLPAAKDTAHPKHFTAQAGQLTGKVQGAGSPIAGATVTLYAATEGKPAQLAQGKTGDDGTFKLDIGADKLKGSADEVLYLVARGGTPKAAVGKGPNDAIALLTVLGSERPKTVTVNEFSTLASVWTGAQFLEGDVLSGTKLGL